MPDFNRADNSGVGTWSHTDFVNPNGSYSSSVVNQRVIWSRVGAVTPNYVEKQKLGKLPMLPLSYRHTVIKGGSGSRVTTIIPPGSPTGVTQEDGGDWGATGSLWGTRSDFDGLSATRQNNVKAQAATRVLNRIKGQKVNILQDLGEARQTIALLTTTAKRLAMGYQAFKRGQLPTAVSILGSANPSRRFRQKYYRLQTRRIYKPGKGNKLVVVQKATTKLKAIKGSGSVFSPTNLASLWLEYQYGWRPLVSSCVGAVELYQQQLEVGKSIRVQSYVREAFENIKQSTTDFASWNHAYHTNITTGSYKVGYTIYYKVTNQDAVLLSQSGLSNPLNLGWELLPFSFVVDWFVGIGNYLSSLDATLGLTFEKGCRTIAHRGASSKTTTFGADYSYVLYSGTVTSTRIDFFLTREVLEDFPSPTRPAVNTRSPNLVRYLSAAALLTTVFSGRKPYRMR